MWLGAGWEVCGERIGFRLFQSYANGGACLRLRYGGVGGIGGCWWCYVSVCYLLYNPEEFCSNVFTTVCPSWRQPHAWDAVSKSHKSYFLSQNSTNTVA